MHLKEWREAQGKTQEWLAEQLKWTQGYISMIERGEQVPSDENAAKIEDFTKGAVSFIELKHPKYRPAANSN